MHGSEGGVCMATAQGTVRMNRQWRQMLSWSRQMDANILECRWLVHVL